jgi:predicted nucleic acid-binding protein
MNKTIVSDTSSLIIFARLNRIDLLANQFERVIIPARVEQEILEKEDDVATFIAENSLFEVRRCHDEDLIDMLDGILDYGEVEALALARELDYVLLIDEKKGRKIALGLKIRIISFLGVLLLNYKQKKLTRNEAEDIISEAKLFKFRLSKNLEDRFFELLK